MLQKCQVPTGWIGCKEIGFSVDEQRTYRRNIVHEILHKRATIHQVTTMLGSSTNVIFPGHNHRLTTGTDDPTLLIINKYPRWLTNTVIQGCFLDTHSIFFNVAQKYTIEMLVR